MFLVVFTLFGCKQKTSNYTVTVLENTIINSEFLQTISPPEKALLSWYLYAYGNECDEGSNTNKCKILKELKIFNECETDHLNNLLKWFSTDMLAVYKLKNCPNLSSSSAIQNSIDKIVLSRNNKTLTIDYKIKGLNNIQEKSWNIERSDSYLIKDNSIQKIQ